MRPTRFCTCGEYVAESMEWNAAKRRIEPRLIHINTDGEQIYRGHPPVEDKR